MTTPSAKDDVSEVVKEEDEDCEDEETEEHSGEEDEESLQKAKQAITCRSVTLNTLMEDGIISHGEGVLSIHYLGQRFEADLLENGKIKWQGSQEEFGTPSAWALHCKRLVNPVKRSGCGWASVKYKNRKLDIWKSIWARKHRTANTFKSPHQTVSTPTTATAVSPSASSSSLTTATVTTAATCGSNTAVTTTMDTTDMPSAELLGAEVRNESTRTKQEDSHGVQKETQVEVTQSDKLSAQLPSAIGKVMNQSQTSQTSSHFEAPLNLSPGKLQASTGVQLPRRGKIPLDHSGRTVDRKIVEYSTLGTRSLEIDPLTLVKCETFDQHSKIQPFTVSITSNTLLLMDFHCHLSKSEVVGYLAGRWDSHTQHLSIEQAFPARCRLGDKERAPLVEEEIHRTMQQKNQMVVGWYHSHPHCQPEPSIRDVDSQISYQLKMRGPGSMYLPCLGFIVSPFEKLPPKPDSKIQAFWVMPNLEHPASYNIPMRVSYSVVRDTSLTEDLLSDMKKLTEFFRGAVDKIHIKEHWGEAITYKDKIKASMRSKLPEDQLDSGTFLDYVQQLLYDMR